MASESSKGSRRIAEFEEFIKASQNKIIVDAVVKAEEALAQQVPARSYSSEEAVMVNLKHEDILRLAGLVDGFILQVTVEGKIVDATIDKPLRWTFKRRIKREL